VRVSSTMLSPLFQPCVFFFPCPLIRFFTANPNPCPTWSLRHYLLPSRKLLLLLRFIVSPPYFLISIRFLFFLYALTITVCLERTIFRFLSISILSGTWKGLCEVNMFSSERIQGGFQPFGAPFTIDPQFQTLSPSLIPSGFHISPPSYYFLS